MPDSLKAAHGIGSLALRPFGVAEADLAVNFNQAQRARLVTELLQHCTVNERDAPPRDFFLDLTIGKRVECLLNLAAAGRKGAFEFKLVCADEICARELELELTLDEIAALQSEADANASLSVELAEKKRLTLRRPSGRDQLSWLEASYADEAEAASEMIRTLADESAPREFEREWIEVINQAMDDFDPLVNFNFSAQCGECGHVSTRFLDLEELALGELRAAQASLLATVHKLATRYHWSEREIFAVPHWRRTHYLALIARDEEG
ncbi:MAG TPA: hypothetical protein VGC91_10785 [Pyrinomonadaceae bacterium]